MAGGGYPTQNEIKQPLLESIAARGGRIIFSHDGESIEDELAEYFGLSDAQRYETRPEINIKGKRVWRLNIQWARKKCVEDGTIDGSIRDVWRLTEKGWAVTRE